jgi:glucan 1,3-beta-glucosidase
MGPVLDMNQIRQFYEKGYTTIREYSKYQQVVIHDAFQSPSSWNNFMTPNNNNNWKNVILDTHVYHVFPSAADQAPEGIEQHVSQVCAFGNQLAALDKHTVVGEWSGAMTDCTKWLNGVGRGARYDGSLPTYRYIGSCASRTAGSICAFSPAEKNNTRRLYGSPFLPLPPPLHKRL